MAFECARLTRTERDNAALGIVGRDADGYPVARDHLDAEPPHATAQLRENFVTGVHLHAVKTTAVHRDDGALHINQIVFTHSILADPWSLNPDLRPLIVSFSERDRQIAYRLLHLLRKIRVIVAR